MIAHGPYSGLCCTYCDVGLPTRFERDHFPVARFLGGGEVVPACMTCHELKDRCPLHHWTPDMQTAGQPLPTRALILMATVLQGRRRLGPADLLDLLEDWEALASMQRILLAKLVTCALGVSANRAPGWLRARMNDMFEQYEHGLALEAVGGLRRVTTDALLEPIPVGG